MSPDDALLPGRLLRRSGPSERVDGFTGVEVHDARLTAVLSPDAARDVLYTFTVHGEGPVWDTPRDRLVCEHGRRCISRSRGDGAPEPIVTHYRGRRLNSPNDVTVAPDGAVWFTDPTFGLLMPNQGSLAEPELDHRSVDRFDPDSGEVRRMADFDEPNGLFLAPDERTLTVSDTARSLGEIVGGHARDTHEILAFDVAADGSLTNRRTDHGYPDGFAVERRGWVWSTAADGIHIYAHGGTRLGFVPTPEIASNRAFHPDGGRLFVAATSRLPALDLIA